MTTLRDAAQAALYALEDIFGANKVDVGAINALRSALAEPEPTQEQTPVAWMSTWITDAGTTLTVVGLSPDEVRHLVSNTNPVFPLFAHAAPAQTPMSEEYARKNPFGGPAARLIACANMIMAGDDYYASLREFGLAEEQTPMSEDALHRIARAVERHHGIGGKE